MEIKQVLIGEKYTFFPRKESADDNRHFPCEVVDIKKLVRVRIFMQGEEGGILRSVHAKRLCIQGDMLTPNV